MTQLQQKSGIRARRKRDAIRFARDQKIYRRIQNSLRGSEIWHRKRGEQIEPLSRYFGKPEANACKFIAHFPLPLEKGENSLPKWEDLSLWMKVQIAMLFMYEYATLAFTIHIHPKLEARFVSKGKNPTAETRNRIRKELAKIPGVSSDGVDWFFCMEGDTDKNKYGSNGYKKLEKTNLHIQGAIDLPDGVAETQIRAALGRACGHGIRGYSNQPRAIHFGDFHTEGPYYGTYLLKFLRRRDERLAERRTAFSRTLTQSSTDFWNGISGRWDVYHGMLYAEQTMARNALTKR